MAKGGYKGSSPARETSPEEYSGVWDIVEQYGEQKTGSWPFQETDSAPKALRFNGSNSYLTRTPLVDGSKTTWTWSAWVKRGSLGATSGFQYLFDCGNGSSPEEAPIRFWTDDRLNISAHTNTNIYNLTTTAKFRDVSAWMSIVVAFNSNEPVANDRIKLYINGEQVTEFDARTNPGLNTSYYINDNIRHDIGRAGTGNNRYFDGMMSEVHFIDGQALSCEEFGFFDGQGIWQPKRFTGDYSSGPVYSNGTLSANPSAGNIQNLFDGNIHPQSSGNQFYIYNQSAITYTFPQPLTGTFKVYAGNGDWNGSSSNSGGTISLNTGASVTLPTPGTQFYYATVGAGTNVTSIRFAPANGGILMGAIYVDDIQLVDASVGRNSFKLDFSNGVKDQSGLGNDWTANNVDAGTPRIETTGAITLSSQNRNFFFKGAVGQSIGVAAGNHVWDSADGVSWTYRGQSGTSVTLTSAYVEISGTTNIAFTNTNFDSVVYWDAAIGYGLPNGPGSGSAETFDVEANGSDGADRFVDSPVNGNEASTGAAGQRRGNYCCFNPLDKHSSLTISDGNLKVQASTSQWELARSTFFLSSGKHYWEFTWTGSVTSSSGVQMGLKTPDSTLSAAAAQAGSYAFQYTTIYSTNGNQNSVVISPGSVTSGDTVMFAYDADAGKMWIGVNGTWNGSGNPATGANPDWTNLPRTGLSPFAGCYGSSNTITLNAGQKAFKYTNHSGFSPIATSFLPEPTLKRGDEALDVTVWSGNNDYAREIKTSVSPDLVWIKNRNQSNHWHHVTDVLRGAPNKLYPNDSQHAEDTAPIYGQVDSIDSDGFTVGDGTHATEPINDVNKSGSTYVAFSWDAGEATTTVAVGSLNSSVYDQSQAWSSGGGSGLYSGSSWAGTFDGTPAADGNNIAHSAYVTNNGSSAVTFSTAISGRLKVTANQGSNNVSTGANRPTVTLSDGSFVRVNAPTNAPEVLDFGNVSNITSLTIAGTSAQGMNLISVELDGKLLVDAINDSQTWSNGLTGLSNSTITNTTRAFNGDPDNYADSTAGFTVDLSGHTFGTGAHTIEVLSGGATSFSVNGSTNLTDPGGGGAKVWTGTHTGELTSLTSSATGASIYYLKIDGKFLVDTGGNIAPAAPSIATTTRSRPDAGFSMITYAGNSTSGASVAHMLQAEPHFIITRNRTTGSSSADVAAQGGRWYVYHKDIGPSKVVWLHAAFAKHDTSSNAYRVPNSSLHYKGSFIDINGTNNNYVSYLWTSIEGYSKFTSFVGTGGDVFVYLGFRPRMIWFKNADTSTNWLCYDTTRNPSNPANLSLQLDEQNTDTTVTNDDIDILSNGFNVKATRSDLTGSGNQILIAAWAEHPFASNSRAR